MEENSTQEFCPRNDLLLPPPRMKRLLSSPPGGRKDGTDTTLRQEGDASRTKKRPRRRPHEPEHSQTDTATDTQPGEPSLLHQHPLVQCLRRLDPLLQFLCKATGHVLVDWTLIQKSLPVPIALSHVQALQAYGVLRVVREVDDDNKPGAQGKERDETSNEQGWKVGFPPPPLTTEATTATTEPPSLQRRSSATPPLHGSTKRGAKQRLAWLQKQLRQQLDDEANTGVCSSTLPMSSNKNNHHESTAVTPELPSAVLHTNAVSTPPASPGRRPPTNKTTATINSDGDEEEALQALTKLFRWSLVQEKQSSATPIIHSSFHISSATNQPSSKSVVPNNILPHQASFAGSQEAQPAIYATLPSEYRRCHVPDDVYRALVPVDRPLYQHQVQAMTASLDGQHVSLTTGTGSGKSLAFLLPVIATIVQHDCTAILLFPTKALAQDQITKLQALAGKLDQPHSLRPATLDGDTPHSQRKAIAASANLILTNPDTLHAAVLPNWEKGGYTHLLAKLAFVVVDEAHTYQGIFGAHVALILARLRRLCAVARAQVWEPEDDAAPPPLRFIAASATLPWPEVHVRKLCSLGPDENVVIIDQDTSPRAAKHFFVWNPPLLSAQGISSGSVTLALARHKNKALSKGAQDCPINSTTANESSSSALDAKTRVLNTENTDGKIESRHSTSQRPRHREPEWHRRHSADETALLLARAVSQGIRCMAFAKTRNLVEWIFERTLGALKSNPETTRLVDKVESYRGGYTREERRKIEERLFRNELLGVVGTNALELGVDVGGIDLTLHCGYPSSYASLLQQAGRAGRGKSRSTSCAVVVCFNSPSEQHLWRHPKTLLSKGLAPTDTIPFGKSTIQSHLLCAASEFPLTGSLAADCIVTEGDATASSTSDWHLFGGEKLYESALEELKKSESCTTEEICLPSTPTFTLYKAHPLLKKAWSLVAIRSIEPVNYSIVDLSHPGQGGRMDDIYCEQAVLDTLPYSRIFYHAHPGAVITHRGTRYKVVSMTRPPEVLSDPYFRFRKNTQLSAFAKPTSARYSTRPLSRMHITIVKQFETVELSENRKSSASCDGTGKEVTLAGNIEHDHNEAKQDKDVLVESSVVSQDCQVSCESSNETLRDNTDSCEDLETYVTSFSGCGVVNVKRTVHGYKKLSLITRTEISRSELSLPDMEFDTFGLWFDVEAHVMTAFLGPRYGEGVHALAHAILAVAPLFEPGLVREDLECDHSYFSPTRLVLFDERAGGSGSCERLWKHFFVPENNILDAALDLLRNCDSCNGDDGYEGGCPACLHASQCIKFNMNLSRRSAAVVGRRILERIKTTDRYKENEKLWKEGKRLPSSPSRGLTPRRKARHEALKRAKEMKSAQGRQYIVGRPGFVRTEGGSLARGEQQERG